MLTACITLICTKICVLIEEVVIDNHRHIRAHLVVLILVKYRSTDRLTELEVCVCLLICNNRAVDILLTPPIVPRFAIFILLHRLLEAHLTTYSMVIYIFRTPTHLNTVVALIEPTIGNIELTSHRQVAVAVVIVVVALCINRRVRKDNCRKFLVFSYR